MNYSIRNDLSLNTTGCEDLWVEIDFKKSQRDTSDIIVSDKLVIGNIYRHPGQNYSTFRDNLCNNIEILNRTRTKYVLVGDYNIDIAKYNLAKNITNYVNSLNSVGCSFFVDKPTRITPSTSSCIDHVYSNLSADRLLTTLSSQMYQTILEFSLK